jgi:uncharacterized membrane protein
MWVVQLLAWIALWSWLSLIGLAVVRLVFGELRPSSYLIARLLGMVCFFGLFWLIGYAHLLPLTAPVLLGGLTATTAVALAYLVISRTVPNWRAFLVSELLFGGLVLAFVLWRGFYPTVTDGEKPMELTMISSVMHATSLPPEDAWLAGEHINYYYFGYFVFGSLAKMLGASSFIAAGFGLASIWALIIVTLGYIGWVTTRSRAAAVLVPVSYAFFSNLNGFIQLVAHWGAPFDWWAPSRALPNTITEFPAFSYLFADFHPHMIATIWLGTLISLVWLSSRAGKSTILQGLLIGVVLGEIFVVSSWSVLTAGIFLIFSLLLLKSSWKTVGAALVTAVVVAWPYQHHLISVWQGIELNQVFSPFGDWLLHWGFILIGLVGFLLAPKKSRLLSAIVGTGVVLVALAEILIVKDYIGGRFNTLFKLYWDAWLFLSIAGGVGLAWLWQQRVWGQILVVGIVLAASSYLVAAYPERFQGFQRWYGGDPAALTFEQRPELLEPYQKLQQLGPADRLYEPWGGSYSGDGYLSAFSGIPTLLGWDGHEALWRNSWEEVERRKQLADGVTGCKIPEKIQVEFHFTYCYNRDGILEKVNE